MVATKRFSPATTPVSGTVRMASSTHHALVVVSIVPPFQTISRPAGCSSARHAAAAIDEVMLNSSVSVPRIGAGPVSLQGWAQ